MADGVKIVNSHGTVLIDSANPVLVLRNKVNAYIPADLAGRTITVDMPDCDAPAFAFVCGGLIAVTYMARLIGSAAWRLQIRALDQGGAAPRDIVIYHFDKPRIVAGSTSGLKVRDPQGNVTFDALAQNAVVTQTLNGGVSATAPAGRMLAFAPMNAYLRVQRVASGIPNQWNENLQGTGFLTTGTTVSVSTNITYQTTSYPGIPPAAGDLIRGAPGGVVMDVTTY